MISAEIGHHYPRSRYTALVSITTANEGIYSRGKKPLVRRPTSGGLSKISYTSPRPLRERSASVPGPEPSGVSLSSTSMDSR